ncbi:MAG: FtsX-like permease family protein [Cyclobacteriaceae bacterium]|nr:FtsX-like permease family protein [Cyclobacteriaceae bacterium]
MKDVPKQSPPNWAQQFLAWYCKPELLEDLQGDLNEYFERNLKSHGIKKAKLIYIIDTFKFFRLYTVRKPEFVKILISWIMIGNYIKTSGRSIVRNKLFSAINIVGLAVSMSVGLLLISLLLDTYSYDKFHVNHSRIYRINSQYQYLENKDRNFMATTSLRAAKAIKETFTVPEEVAILRNGFGGDMTFGEKTIPLNGLWANESMFSVFTFPLVKGNPANALKNPYSVVLTEKAAHKLFGDEEAIGKTIILNKDKAYTITGIVQDVPTTSHMKFEMLGAISTREITEKDNADELAWDNMWNTYVYLKMPVQFDPKLFQTNLDNLSAKENPSVKNTTITLKLQAMDSIMAGESLGNQLGPTMGSTLLWVFAGLSFVVILSACFNYTNLSVARSLKRSREIGIRKTIGALRGHVMGQFVVEAIIISFSALVAAFLLFLALRPYFKSMEPSLQALLTLNVSPLLVICFVGFALFIGVAAGLFPALFFSRINAVQVLKGSSTTKGFKKLTLRKALIVFQYTISLILITATLIMYKQYKHYMNFDLGFSTENILNIRLQGNKAEILKKELNELPEVKGISLSGMITSVGSYWGVPVKNPNNPEDSLSIAFNVVDENYIPLHDHHLLAGKNFTVLSDSAVESEVIVNEQVLKRFNLPKDPTLSIGEILSVTGKELRIVGVMRDFQYGRANNETGKETIFRYSRKDAQHLNVKLLSNDLPATYAKIETIWKKLDTVHAFEAKFYDDEIEESFKGLSASMKLAGAIAFLAVCIASLGLLGMVVFTTETRLKEISIRKVMGATEGGLVYLLGRGFFILLGIAALIALPLTYFFFEQIMLPKIANHAPLGLFEGVIAVMAVMTIALLMIGSQTLKVAKANPAEVLKNE